MRRNSALLVILIALLAPTVALAQDYTCTQTTTSAGFTLACKPVKTATPTRTPVATATPTNTPTPQPTATATPVPTATATPTPLPVTPVTGAILNVPLLAVALGAPELDANHWAMTWLGNVSSGDNYVSVRIIGNTDGLRLRLQAIDRSLTSGDAVTVTLNGAPLSQWTIEPRGGNGNDDLRGWSASSGVLPWATFGGMPTIGAVWPLTIQRTDADTGRATTQAVWSGAMHWGAPTYATVRTANYIDVPLTGDSMLGGGTDCGDRYDYPEYFPGWGTRNWGSDPFAMTENQWDVADWPCSNKWVAKWDLPAIPDGATVTGAELSAAMFGQMGYGCGYCADGTGDTVWQAYQIPAGWNEATVNWDSAPNIAENVSATLVRPVPDAPAWDGQPITYTFDVGEIVQRAYAAGDSAAAVLFATAAGQYHSGKYFYSREGAMPPTVRIYYQVAVTPTPTPTNTPTAAPTATPTQSPTATATRTPTPTATPTSVATMTPTPQPTTGNYYYISPTGADSNIGAIVAPWATFNRAWQTLKPGDTLIVMDGTYKQVLWPNVRDGQPGKPITVKAMHDGQATIDAQGGAVAIKLGESWPGPIGNYFVIEGLVARNAEDVILIYGHHNTLRRVSAYDADTNSNSSIITVAWTHDVLLEDTIASGTGRKNILIFSSTAVTVRRAFLQWTRWDGAEFCNAGWPAGNGVNVYSSSNVLVENAIATGPFGARAINLTNQSETAANTGNRVFGSIAIGTYKNADGSWYEFPLPTNPCNYKNPPVWYEGNGAGLGQITQGTQDNPIWRDVLMTGFRDAGYINSRPFGTGAVNPVLDHATIYGNDLAGNGSREVVDTIGNLTITNSWIEGTQYQGTGARLSNRYVDGTLTDVPLWPWPMEDRAQTELGYSVTATIYPYVQQATNLTGAK
jgi:hypothetical protein